ncbi:MAG: DNA-processing protein DprA [Halieaceae bacterium]|jgi:DNA processing protein|nr:DNA-processing protein DprA [Halieaceae bacterium]
MDADTQRQWLVLAHLPLSGRSFSRLAASHPDAGDILALPGSAWRAAGASEQCLDMLRRWQRGRCQTLAAAVDAALSLLQQDTLHLIPLGDARYPPLLARIDDPPALLYVAGNPQALSLPQFSIVGSRRCSAASARAASEFSAGLVGAGYSICSGLALGVDAAAHRAALAVGGSTVAVIATGIDRCYPARHRALFDEICNAGAVVTTFNPGVAPRREHFPQRNRLISGLSVGVLVVEAGLGSGSLITARSALEQNREVFALPHSIYDPGGAGCHQLLRQGAGLAETVADLLAETGALRTAHAEIRRERAPPPPHLRKVWGRLGHAALSVDELVAAGAGNVEQVLAALVQLEQDGFVEQRGGLYERKL